MAKLPAKTWFQHKSDNRQWYLLEFGGLQGFSISLVAADKKDYVCPPGCEDDCEEWESGRVSSYDKDFTKKAVAAYKAGGAVAVLELVWKEGFQL